MAKNQVERIIKILEKAHLGNRTVDSQLLDQDQEAINQEITQIIGNFNSISKSITVERQPLSFQKTITESLKEFLREDVQAWIAQEKKNLKESQKFQQSPTKNRLELKA